MRPNGTKMQPIIYNPIETTDAAIVETLGGLRVAAWLDSGARFSSGFLPESGLWLDELDHAPDTRHWIIRNEAGKIIAGARLTTHTSWQDVPDGQHFSKFASSIGNPLCSVNRLFVNRDYWGLGLGESLLRARLEYALKQNVGPVVAYACSLRVGVLRRYGFETLGVVSDDDGIIVPNSHFYVMATNLNDDRLCKSLIGNSAPRMSIL